MSETADTIHTPDTIETPEASGQPDSSAPQVRLTELPPLRLVATTFHVDSQPEIGPRVGPAFDQVADALVAAGQEPQLAVALYDHDAATGGFTCTVGFTHDGEGLDGVQGVEVVDVPAVDQAATLEHHGDLVGIGDSWGALMAWCDHHGRHMTSDTREVYVHSPAGDMTDWVTELQQPVVPE